MAKRRRETNQITIEKRIHEGRGQGRGSDYKPWLLVQDVPSQGLATRIKGWKTKRIHHLLSNLELNYFYVLEWSPVVFDIREQYPLLPLEETLAIAEQCDIRHPTDPKTKEPVVMTTDFFITVPRSIEVIEQARTLKTAKDLQSKRTVEKLEIERCYWHNRNIDWGIETSIGVNVNDQIRQSFRRGIKLFYENQKGRTLKDTYQLTLEKFFHKGYEMQDGVLVPVLPPASELPTFAQFRYWYEKERDLTQVQISRKGERRFNLRHRAVLGDSTQMAFGPGSLYQIDATIGDIYLVSSLDRNRIIGRPVIYFVIDTFSRLIAGFSVSLEGPSWLGAMLALENATTNKVAFCQEEFGIQIDEADWPSHHLPEGILADRGELEGYNADNLVNALNVRISNTPPYRADWKGIVERNFRLSNDKMIRWIPGAVNRNRERGDKDYRLDAVLDLHQFEKLITWCVLEHNNNHRMNWYRLDEFMIQEYVDPYPIELWNWGVKNRVGHLRTMTPEIIRLNLLPAAEASVTYRGIYYQGLYYTCELALREQWFVKARAKGRWKIPIAYEPRRLDCIYLRLNGGMRLESCHLIDAEKTFKGRDWYEIIDYFERQKQAEEASRTRQQQSSATFHAQVDQIVAKATEQTEKASTVQSKRSRIQGIRGNRKLEREHERETGSWQLGIDEISKPPGQVIPLPSVTQPEEDDEGYVAPPKPIDKLRKLREKNWNNDQ